MTDPVLVLRVGQQMIDVLDRADGLMEYVYWDKYTGAWKEDAYGAISSALASALNRLKAPPSQEDIR